MARNDPEPNVTLSLLDRLTDNDLSLAADPPVSRAQSVRQLKASLRQDLEWLLNTRRVAVPPPEGCTEVERSVYVYGLPDLTSFSLNNVKDQDRIQWLLESAISIFEPRLESVNVRMQELSPGDRQVRFQIEGLLRMDPAPERITFDTVLELTSGTYKVKGDADTR